MSKRHWLRTTWRIFCSTTVRSPPHSCIPSRHADRLWFDSPTEIEELEEEEVHLAAELTVMTPYASNQEDDEKAASWRLASVPAALQKELDDYKVFRTSPLNRSRDGTACIDIVRSARPTLTLPYLPTPCSYSRATFPSLAGTTDRRQRRLDHAALPGLPLCRQGGHAWLGSVLPQAAQRVGRGMAQRARREGAQVLHVGQLLQQPLCMVDRTDRVQPCELHR